MTTALFPLLGQTLHSLIKLLPIFAVSLNFVTKVEKLAHFKGSTIVIKEVAGITTLE